MMKKTIFKSLLIITIQQNNRQNQDQFDQYNSKQQQEAFNQTSCVRFTPNSN